MHGEASWKFFPRNASGSNKIEIRLFETISGQLVDLPSSFCNSSGCDFMIQPLIPANNPKSFVAAICLQEIYYYVGKGDLVRNDDMTKESTAVTVRDANNKELVEALTTGDGPLLAGLQPAARVANEAGQQALTQALTDEKVDKKKAKKEKKDKTEKMEPKTSEEPNP